MNVRRLLWAAGATGAALAAVPLAASLVWQRQIRERIRQLDTPVGEGDASRPVVVPDIGGVPPPVQRYLSAAVRPGRPIVRAVDLVTEGQFQTATGDGGWRTFRAEQRFSTDPVGFVWDARIHMAPLMPAFVRDVYMGRRAEMTGKVVGVYPVVNEADSPELASGQLMRYLAETVWFPTALLPGCGVAWHPLDDQRARASIEVNGTRVSLDFTFDRADNVIEVSAPDRWRSVNGGYEPTRWTVRCAEHADRDGLRIPIWCEAEWGLPEGPLPYWRGRVVSVRYAD